ncbi:glutathione S-transferase family protein [Sansalvadorimonas sp. 2012CJ34-2]|uniref:Glutathione S-transferase family protein n=1 Tax=Parendozoicomonas callyspongiae TaxID=2942213 RepID=A0ABT0PE88_9GAMM|nr:glutathione S-transferase family protein [Sansalvadorimonas sp. 2012CJ34-2]MCL6269682.1 glutathione S-transferase family protein [Sansalvadorimonas sp. 2012CJ34-2]
MKIYETHSAPNPRRVRVFLAEKGIADVEYIQVDIQKGDNLKPEVLARNPLGKVPYLELDDGTCISETVAICRYFEELQPEPSLMGSTPQEKAEIEMWQRLCEFYFSLPVGMCFQHTTGYFSDRMNPVKEWGIEAGKNAAKFMSLIDNQLAENKYVAGDTFSIADITLLCAVDFARVIKLRMTEEHPNLQRWHALVSSRESAKA